jgi:hypothetical protein
VLEQAVADPDVRVSTLVERLGVRSRADRRARQHAFAAARHQSLQRRLDVGLERSDSR